MKQMILTLALLWAGAAQAATFTPTNTNSPTGTFTPSSTATPSTTPTRTVTPTNTRTATKTITLTWSASPTFTSTRTVTKTNTVTQSNTKSATPTFSNTQTPTCTATPSNTPVASFTRTVTPTNTPLNTPVASVLQALGTSMVPVDPNTGQLQGITVFGSISVTGSADYRGVSVVAGVAGISVTASLASGQGLSITAISAGQGLSVTSAPVFNAVSHSTYVWATGAATVTNLTAAAGVNGRMAVGLAPSFGGALIRWDYGTSATAPTDLYSVGCPIQTSGTAQFLGTFEAGTILYVQGAGASSVTGKQLIDQVK